MSAPMDKVLARRFRVALLDASSAVFVDRRALAKDPQMIACDGWLVPVPNPSERIGGFLVYVDTGDAVTFWHRYYCGEERNPNRIALGKGIVGWAVSQDRVDMIRREVDAYNEQEKDGAE